MEYDGDQRTPASERTQPTAGLETGARSLAAPLAMLALVLAVFGGLHLIGISARREITPAARFNTKNSAETYALLERSGVRGRIVVMIGSDFQSYPSDLDARYLERAEAAGTTSAAVDVSNLAMALAIFGPAREVYRVVPDGTLSGHAGASHAYLDRFDAVPFVDTESSKVPNFGEKIVVLIEESGADGIDPSTIARLTDPGAADMVVLQKGS